jgi:1-phosphofructokinase
VASRYGGGPLIITVTPNPSVDRTVEIAELRRGQVLRALGGRIDPGGKGVNVARALLANGHKALAVLPVGGMEGDRLVALLQEQGVEPRVVPIAQSIRSNITVAEPDGTVTKLNESGPTLDADEVEALLAAAESAAREQGGDQVWAAGCGSLSAGMPAHFYALLTTRMRASGARVAIDTSGTALAEALTASPDLIKPNAEELAELTGRALETVGEVVEAAAALRDRGVGSVLVSLGADGALLVDRDGLVHASSPPQKVASTVGAGDSLLAGFLSAGATGAAALVEAVAWGAAAAGLPGTRLPGPDDLDREHVTVTDRIDLGRPLKGD